MRVIRICFIELFTQQSELSFKDARLGVQIELLQNTLSKIIPSLAILSRFGVGLRDASLDPYMPNA
jgi:predicted Kef-type K+ transport protein